jgi:hypothetical protein
LYASTTVAGGFQTAVPVAPNNIVQVAAVINKSINQGVIFIRPSFGSNINQDEGVKITSVSDKDLLQYQSGTALWENKTLAQVIGTAYVPSTRTITINGTTQDLSANRTYNVGTVTSVGLSSATSGVTIGSTPVTGSGTITLAIATASGSQNGLLSSTDWTTFNNKQNALTNPVTGTGTSGQVAYFNGTSSITGESGFTWDATNNRLSIGGATPNSNLTVSGSDNTDIFTVLAGANSRLHVGTVTSGTNVYVRSQNNYTLNLGVNTTNYLSIFNSGNLFIGTSASDAGFRLDVNGTARVQGQLTTTADAVVNGVNIGKGGGNVDTNTRVGTNALNANTTGLGNTSIGWASLFSNTTGVSNVAIGRDSGRFIADGTTPNTITNNSIFIGRFTRSNADNQTNQIVIGHQAIGLGSNTIVIGNSGTTFGRWFGNLLIGDSTNTGEQLQVTGTAKITGAATFSSSVTANSLLVERSASRNMLGISSISLPTSGAEEGVAVIKTNSNLWQMSLVGYAADSKGLRIYNNGGTGYTSLEVATGAGTAFIVDGNGRVGIGTASPNIYNISNGAHLTLSTSTANYAVITAAGSAGNGGEVDFGNQTVRHAAIASLDGSNLGFYTNGTNSGTGVTERMRITSVGNLEISTGSIKTGNPSGSSAQPFKVGSVTTSSNSFFGTVVKMEINGTVYDVMIATPPL